MKATEMLRQEHDAILKMLDGLDQLNKTLPANPAVAKETLYGFLEFFRHSPTAAITARRKTFFSQFWEKREFLGTAGPSG